MWRLFLWEPESKFLRHFFIKIIIFWLYYLVNIPGDLHRYLINMVSISIDPRRFYMEAPRYRVQILVIYVNIPLDTIVVMYEYLLVDI